MFNIDGDEQCKKEAVLSCGFLKRSNKEQFLLQSWKLYERKLKFAKIYEYITAAINLLRLRVIRICFTVNEIAAVHLVTQSESTCADII